jgi:hypothetical protein
MRKERKRRRRGKRLFSENGGCQHMKLLTAIEMSVVGQLYEPT